MNAASTRATENLLDCAQRKRFFLENILRDIEAHESGRFDEIDAWKKTMPLWEKYADAEEEARLSIAYNFCDSWRDARNHAWNYYPDIAEKDWPIIVRQIYHGLDESWAPDAMRDNFVFNSPPEPPQGPLWQRLKNLFRAPQ